MHRCTYENCTAGKALGLYRRNMFTISGMQYLVLLLPIGNMYRSSFWLIYLDDGVVASSCHIW